MATFSKAMLAALLLRVANAATLPERDTAPTATIDIGTVVGTSTAVPGGNDAVNQFLGIPFAVSPPERFSPPQPTPAASSPIQATAFSPACIQQFNAPAAVQQVTGTVFNNPPPAESEDCLYLNVFAPANDTPGKTVMFWIYGGALQFGNAGQPVYDGSSFAANQDVIVVSTNYRTNAFGFSNSPEIPLTSRNVGFLDQRLALDWVQRNIEAFGGDPQKVTIFGESSGAASVDRLVTTLPDNPPFRGAITESGQATVSPNANTGGPAAWTFLVNSLNCSTSTSQLACVRAAPATTIKSIIEANALSFSPVTDNITQLATGPSLIARRAAGNVAKVPYLTGSNGQEGRIFIAELAAALPLPNTTAYIQSTFPAPLQQPLIDAYTPLPGTAFDQISQLFTELYFQCPAALVAKTSQSAAIPTFRYYYNATFANLQTLPGVDLQAFHSSEIPLVFGNLPPNSTADEIALSGYMQTAWADFAKDPAAGPGWTQVDAAGAGKYIADIGGVVGGTSYQLITEQEIDERCVLFQPIYDATLAPAFKRRGIEFEAGLEE
ncbi:MAG: hypothetical protein Q9160_000664 [Pyrenula sp. 1 TL-2023]